MTYHTFSRALGLLLISAAITESWCASLVWVPASEQGRANAVVDNLTHDAKGDPIYFDGVDSWVKVYHEINADPSQPLSVAEREAKVYSVIYQAINSAYLRGFREVDIHVKDNSMWGMRWVKALSDFNNRPGANSSDPMGLRVSINVPAWAFYGEIRPIALDPKIFPLLRSQISYIRNNINRFPSIYSDLFADLNPDNFIAQSNSGLPVDNCIAALTSSDPCLTRNPGTNPAFYKPYLKYSPSENGYYFSKSAAPNIGRDEIVLTLAAYTGWVLDITNAELAKGAIKTPITGVILRWLNDAESNLGAYRDDISEIGDWGFDFLLSFQGELNALYDLKAYQGATNPEKYLLQRQFFDARQKVYRRFLRWFAAVAQSKKLQGVINSNALVGFYYAPHMSGRKMGSHDVYDLLKNSGVNLLINSDYGRPKMDAEYHYRKLASTETIARELGIAWENELSWPQIRWRTDGGDILPITKSLDWNGDGIVDATLTGNHVWDRSIFSTDEGRRNSILFENQMRSALALGARGITYCNWQAEMFIQPASGGRWESVIGPASPDTKFKAALESVSMLTPSEVAVYLPTKGRIVCDESEAAELLKNSKDIYFNSCGHDWVGQMYSKAARASSQGKKVDFLTDRMIKDNPSILNRYGKILIPRKAAKSMADLDSDIIAVLSGQSSKVIFISERVRGIREYLE